jgi:uncharacterized protein YecE (DUF72 family)
MELDLAARMAEQSCQIMLWQQAVAAGQTAEARTLARQAIESLQSIEQDFNACWPLRNKGTPRHSTPFLRWRLEALKSSGPHPGKSGVSRLFKVVQS